MNSLKITLKFCVILLATSKNSIAQNSLSENENFNGRIMTIVEIYEEKSKGSEKNPTMKSELVFNPQAQLIKKISGDFGFIYSYDETGKRKGAVVLQTADSIGFITYKYNTSGKIIEEKNSNGLLTTYVYDTLNNTTKTSCFGKGGKLISNTLETFDRNGLIMEKKYYIASGFSERLAEHFKYTHNEEENYIEISQEFCDATFYKTNFKVTQKFGFDGGLWIEEEKYNDAGEFVSKESGAYDQHSNQITFSRYNAFGEVTELNTYEYKYDETGNWIQKNSFRDGQLLIVQKREIVYYL